MAIGGTGAFIAADDTPFESIDPIDFPEAELERIYSLYVATYSQVEGGTRFNIQSALALLEFDRFVLLTSETGEIVAFVLAKTTSRGVKICVAGHDGHHGRALIVFHIDALNGEGVFAEVSGPLELRLGAEVPSVSAEVAAAVLAPKTITPSNDAVHYTREIANLGPREKKLVGKPRLAQSAATPVAR